MKIKLNISNKFFYTLIAITALLFILAAAYAAVNVVETQPWHVLQQIANSSTSKKSIDSNNDGKIDAAFLEGAGLDCKHYRSGIIVPAGSYTAVKIYTMWCDSTYKKMMFCTLIDGNAGSTTPTPMTTCTSNGECTGSGRAPPAALWNAELEPVSQTGGIEGCLAYSYTSLGPNSIDITCCR
jgi:hypothetical protein